MNAWQRVVTIAVLLTVAGGSLFGFLATYEPGDFLVWRIVYAGLGFVSLCGLLATIFTWNRQARA